MYRFNYCPCCGQKLHGHVAVKPSSYWMDSMGRVSLLVNMQDYQQIVECPNGHTRLQIRAATRALNLPEAVHADMDLCNAAHVIAGHVLNSGDKDALTRARSELFRTPAQLNDGSCTAKLCVVHDGPPAAPFFNYDYEDYASIEQMTQLLNPLNVYTEDQTGWYSAIFKKNTGE